MGSVAINSRTINLFAFLVLWNEENVHIYNWLVRLANQTIVWKDQMTTNEQETKKNQKKKEKTSEIVSTL